MSEFENGHSSKTSTKEDVLEDKLLFMRNQQVQKLYNEYNFDRELNKNDAKEKIDQKLRVDRGISHKSTKFTTLN